MSRFEECHNITKVWEGGWSDHKKDRGGKTMYGVTQATLSDWLGRPASAAEIRNLSMATALQIYRKNYWNKVSGDSLPPGVDLCVYDFGVNSGPSRAVKSLQTALGVKADGWVGVETLKAIVLEDKRDLINLLCDRRLTFLKSLGSDQWATFGKGWSRRVADIRKRALAMQAGTEQAPKPIVSEEGTAKGLPPAPVEKTVTTEQKVGGAAAAASGAAVVLGPVAGFWRDNKDVLADPMFLAVAGVLVAVVVFLLLRKAKPVEATG